MKYNRQKVYYTLILFSLSAFIILHKIYNDDSKNIFDIYLHKVKACVHYFLNDSPSKTMKNVFYFI